MSALEFQNTFKRDFLINNEKRFQNKWKEERIFEVDAPSLEDEPTNNINILHEKYPKFFGTMAYPYMNGSLHLGHAFTMTKVDFAIGFERMRGKRCLFPLGMHCTGMPIKACADRLKQEIELFGQDFSGYTEAKNTFAQCSPNKIDLPKFHAKKGKVALKKHDQQYQFQVMQLLGIPNKEIYKFADAKYWLTYFPDICKEDATNFGARIDWRRSFITTDTNPYYDSFIRWQMNRLKQLQKIKFGERYTIFSAKENQPCMDHDRQHGEGINPQEYTCIKLKVISWSENVKSIIINSNLFEKNIYMIAATLRPETIYGQTCCFVKPDISYGIFESNDPNEYFLCTSRAAKNMAFQKLSPGRGIVNKIVNLVGSSMIGTKVKAPLSIYEEVYVLPMENILVEKGTGIVISVPSDSPDDYATILDLTKKADYYKIKKEWISFELLPIIHTPVYGNLAAPELYKKMKIQSPKDFKQLAEAKELIYKQSYYHGTMLIGKYKGEKIEKAKPKVRSDLIAKKVAFIYSEPEGLVISRSGDECIVALCDQWYIDYGEENWKHQAKKCLHKMETYGDETKHGFEGTLEWLNQWACSRSYGLGSRLPWDPQYLVESLTDSTIYMSYYTIAHFLHEDIMGAKKGPAGIEAEDMTDDVWDYIFCRGPIPNTKIPILTLDNLKREFEYFYPLDLRVSGKDLIPNHLTFWIYIHTAIFQEEMWPKAVRGNGHLLLNGEKMSKSKGNFLTLKEVVEKFGADATRLAMADAGDSLDDANFEETTANSAILRLYTLSVWCEEQIKKLDNFRTGEMNFHDNAFENEMNELIQITYDHYANTSYKLALKVGFYDFQAARDWYREVSHSHGMHKNLIKRWIEIQALLMLPFIPHFSEFIWLDILKNESCIHHAHFPIISKPIDTSMSSSLTYLRYIVRIIREEEGQLLRRQKKVKNILFDPKKPKKITILVATKFPEWQQKYVNLLQECYNKETNSFNDEVLLFKASEMKEMRRSIPFIQQMKSSILNRSKEVTAEEAFQRRLPFNELNVLYNSISFLKQNLGITMLEIFKIIRNNNGKITSIESVSSNNEIITIPDNIDNAIPGHPIFLFENI
ncbi:leucine-tRNA ligase [Pneumocystis jirovecii RU7]|uniref:leucine--tRNA ligase n=1 Tax=Pneumocystis jirovecii (strain RU7) TaxID=1408657 RepID=A0A0W4ZNK4_PNEJ7|nr:leucine-tRNA ligase [Pneumocystis jirovecii RU7]KTW29950.1 leucine-tRNA ligase [Pneumocystis jirovecii RU7]